MRRLYVDDYMIAPLRLFLQDFNIWHIAGTHSISVPSMDIKIVLRSVCKEWEDLNGERLLLTPGEAARVELSREFPGVKRLGWPGPMIKLFDKPVPLYFTGPTERKELYYVDIKSAYWQIYTPICLDTCFPCGRGVLPLWKVGQRLRDWKEARNSVIGVCRSRTATGQKGRRITRLATTNAFLSPGLWATVVEVLHSLALVAQQSGGLVYFNTDGGIFECYDKFELFCTFLRSAGISYRTELGEGQIFGWGSYEVGGKKAGGIRPAGGAFRPFSTLYTPFNGILDWWISERRRLERVKPKTD